jgi:MFS transporter, AAHS family, 4-hydroxybenzoate transporter
MKGKQPEKIARMANAVQPGLGVTAATRFVISDEFKSVPFSPGLLFSGALRYVTPLLWLVYIANSMTLLFLQNWLPVLIEAVGIQPDRAALMTAMFSVGGAAGGLALMRFLDDRGPMVIACLPIVGVPLVAMLGHDMPKAALTLAVFGVGFCVVGTQFGLNAVSAMVYPTAFRSKGTGAALAIAKIGSFLGPVIGGALLARDMPVRELFHVAALPLSFVAILTLAMGWFHGTRPVRTELT